MYYRITFKHSNQVPQKIKTEVWRKNVWVDVPPVISILKKNKVIMTR